MTRRFVFSKSDSRQILLDQVQQLLHEARRMAPGVERERVLRRARSIEVEANLEEWANSPGLRSPD